MQATWMPHEEHGRLSARSDLPDTVYAFPNQRKDPLTDAQHVRNAARGSIRSSAFPMPIGLWPSPTSRRLRNTITSSFRRRHGAISAFTRNAAGKRLPPKASRPSGSAEN